MTRAEAIGRAFAALIASGDDALRAAATLYALGADTTEIDPLVRVAAASGSVNNQRKGDRE